jgi:PAS domain S-box-containing protein
MPPGLPPVRSYLAVPVCNRAGEVLGGLLFGHPEPGIFDAECEDLMATIASQTALAIDNFRLADTLTHEIALADAARALQRQTSDRLRQALDAAHLGTWVWDRETDRLDLDERAAQLFGVAPGESVTRTALRERIVLTEDLQHTTDGLQNALETGSLYQGKYRLDIEGAPTWIAASGIATFLPGTTTVAGMVGTVQDISTRKTQEATLRQSEKLAATGRLAATIAHEINNPLEAVTNLIYLCKTDPAVPAEARQLLETADTELVRVGHIAQQTLGFYRDTTRPVPINLNQLLQGIVSLFSRKLQYKRLNAVLDLQPNLAIHGLMGEIRQVFSNLVVNAIDASSSADILIRARHTPGGVTVLIADHGSGIPAAIRSRLFSPFFTTKQSVGTGLGLWVTRGIVEKQGGRIAYRSRTAAPSGTVFRVFLPSAPPPPGLNGPFPTQP